MTKFYAQEKRVFDINKVTVVGSPTITSDGVASGFDSANANNIQIPTAIISQIATANTWKVEVGGTIQESGSTYSNVRSDNIQRYDLIHLNRYANGFIFVCCLDENGTTVSKNIHITFSNDYNNKAYKATLEFTGTKYIATVQFEDGTILTNSLESTNKVKFYNYGDKFELGYKCINGSINLKNFKIYVGNQLVYTPTKPTYFLERRKEGFDLSKFTVVGSPTITETGVASGFSSENYIGFTNGLNSLTKPFKVSCIFKTNFSSTSAAQPLWTIIDTSFTSNSTRLVISTGKKMVFQTFVSGTNHKTPDSSILLDNTWYKAICWQDNDGSMHLKYYPLGHEELAEIKVLDTANLVNIQNVTTAVFGKSIHSIEEIYLGQTDLPSFSITVDGKEVFTGAKEKFYAMKGVK